MSKINIANFVDCTEVEGPGKRFVIWVQGCLKRCEGCCNPEMQPVQANKIIETTEIVKLIFYAKDTKDIEGITILGGEPFLQTKGLSEIAQMCQSAKLSVLVFTGYTFGELKEYNFGSTEKMLGNCDVLIDGEFDRTHLDTKRNWIGSGNQRIHYLTDFYRKGIEYDKRYIDGLEFRINMDRIIINGNPSLLKLRA